MDDTTPGPMDGRRTDRRWRDRAACRATADPELFFPTAESGPARDAQEAAAKAWCARCPVVADCLAEALARIPYGVAGGLTEQERRRLYRTTGTGSRTAGVAADVLTDGVPPGTTRRERAGVGRSLLAAGRTTRQVAGDCGVTTRSVQRWARIPANGRTTSASEQSHGATGLPS